MHCKPPYREVIRLEFPHKLGSAMCWRLNRIDEITTLCLSSFELVVHVHGLLNLVLDITVWIQVGIYVAACLVLTTGTLLFFSHHTLTPEIVVRELKQ